MERSGSGVYKLVDGQKDGNGIESPDGLEIQRILVHNMNKKREGVRPVSFNR